MFHMMNEINEKILIALHSDGRITNTKLAKDLGINVATVAKRINSMMKDNIFTIRGVVNPHRSGHRTHAFITLDMDLKEINNVCTRLVENPNVGSVHTMFGKFDLLLTVDFPNSEILLDFVKKEISQIKGIKEIKIDFISEYKKLSLGPFTQDVTDDQEIRQLDDLDKGLIKELGKNGRIENAVLAKKFGTSPATVSRRISTLLRKNIIKIIAVPNLPKLGINTNAFITLAGYSEVHYISTLINDGCIVVGVHFPTAEILQRFILEKVVRLDGILDMETLIEAELNKFFYLQPVK
jgi:DNA-binding Lrp family transcriptional regulator